MDANSEYQGGSKTVDTLGSFHSELNRAELLEALKTEIDQLEKEQARPGRSRWGILGALATLTWLILSEIESTTPLLKQALFVFLAASLLYEAMTMLEILLTPHTKRRKQAARFFDSAYLLGEYRLLCICEFLRALVLLITAFFVAQKLALIFVAPILLVILFAEALLFAASYVNVPLLDGLGKVATKNGVYIWLAIASSIGCLVATGPPDLQIKSIRLGILATAVTCLLVQLCKDLTVSPFLKSLQKIQRDLSYNLISLKAAMQEAEIVMLGLSFDVLLRGHLRPSVEVMETLSTNLGEIAKKLKTANEVNASMISNKTGDEMQLPLVSGITASVGAHLEQAQQLIIDLEGKEKSLKEKATLISTIAPNTKQEIETALGQFQNQFNRLKTQFSDLQTEVQTLRAKIL